MGEETSTERKERLVADAISLILTELAENAQQPRNELDGWDHKREYRRLRNLAVTALKLAKRPHKFFEENK